LENLILFLVLMLLGFSAGTLAERRHYKSIRTREAELVGLPAITIAAPIPEGRQVRTVAMVTGSAVISVDYFKRFLAGLRNIFGGAVVSYESLVDRARREALLRMKAAAGDAAMITNVRIETSAIGKSRRRKSTVGCLEVLAYGTAIYLEP